MLAYSDFIHCVIMKRHDSVPFIDKSFMLLLLQTPYSVFKTTI